MLTILTTEITQILDQTMAKVTVQFPITDIPTDEDSILKAVKDALRPGKAEQAPAIPVASSPKRAASKGK